MVKIRFTFLPAASTVDTSSRCRTPKLRLPPIIAEPTFELNATCCTWSMVTPGQPPASIVRNAIDAGRRLPWRNHRPGAAGGVEFERRLRNDRRQPQLR